MSLSSKIRVRCVSLERRTRTAIARTLAFEPRILLMDEPFAALDEITRFHLEVQLRKLWQERGMTVLFVTHSIDEAVFLSDRIVVMTPRPGTIAEILEIDLPRPRSLDQKDTPAFNAYTGHIRKRFLELGVLKDG